jgi:hypothetical protein
MFNPFAPFTKDLLHAFTARGKIYFVRQTYLRGKSPLDRDIKGCFLFSHYDNITTAQDHFGTIAHDRYRFLYNWNEPGHRGKLEIAASGLRDYKNYAAVFRTEWEKHDAMRLKDKLRMYIKHLGWNPHRDEGVHTNYEIQFGELFIRIKHGGREAKVKLEEVEKVFL